MAHVYASVGDAKRYSHDVPGDAGTQTDIRIRYVLESVARTIDWACERTGSDHPMSGFGPRLGTNRYDMPPGRTLYLDDDILSITSVTTYDVVGGSGTSLTDETHYLKVPYDRTPYRALILHEDSPITAWGTATRGNVVVVKAGWQDERTTSASVTTEALDASETGVDVTAGTDFDICHTILIDSEQMYVTAIASNTLTVIRGANGTTAATHLTGAAIAIYAYPADVRETNMEIYQRRIVAVRAGLIGEFGGTAAVPTVAYRDTERSIIRSILWPYVLPGAA